EGTLFPRSSACDDQSHVGQSDSAIRRRLAAGPAFREVRFWRGLVEPAHLRIVGELARHIAETVQRHLACFILAQELPLVAGGREEIAAPVHLIGASTTEEDGI